MSNEELKIPKDKEGYLLAEKVYEKLRRNMSNPKEISSDEKLDSGLLDIKDNKKEELSKSVI